MNKVQEFFRQLSGAELPSIKITVDVNVYINLFLLVASLMLLYYLLFQKKSS